MGEVQKSIKRLEAKIIGEQIFDGEWRTVQFYTSPIGVPIEPDSEWGYEYVTANALRWWFLAESRAAFVGVETRLHEYRVTKEISSESSRVIEEVDSYVGPA